MKHIGDVKPYTITDPLLSGTFVDHLACALYAGDTDSWYDELPEEVVDFMQDWGKTGMVDEAFFDQLHRQLAPIHYQIRLRDLE